MSKLQDLKKRAFEDPQVKLAYAELGPEFSLIRQLIEMRSKAGLTQAELAQRMGTQKSNISRLETGNTNPSWKTLTNYALACGFKLRVEYDLR